MAGKRDSGHPMFPVQGQSFKFDREADSTAQAQFTPLFDTDGNRIVMPAVQQARVQAQMKSHMKPKNRAR